MASCHLVLAIIVTFQRTSGSVGVEYGPRQGCLKVPGHVLQAWLSFFDRECGKWRGCRACSCSKSYIPWDIGNYGQSFKHSKHYLILIGCLDDWLHIPYCTFDALLPCSGRGSVPRKDEAEKLLRVFRQNMLQHVQLE